MFFMSFVTICFTRAFMLKFYVFSFIFSIPYYRGTWKNVTKIVYVRIKKNNSFYTIENFSTISTATQIRNKKLDKFFMALKAGTTRIVA